MVLFSKVTIILLLMCTLVIQASRARRRRRQNVDKSITVASNKRLSENNHIQNIQRESESQKSRKNPILSMKPDGRQYYLPYRGNYGYGTIQGINYPYGSSGVGPYIYGYGQYGQLGQGAMQYAAYYNQNPAIYGYYTGFNSASYYNRPGYYSSNYYPAIGGDFYGNYYWNAGSKQAFSNFIWLYLIFRSIEFCLY